MSNLASSRKKHFPLTNCMPKAGELYPPLRQADGGVIHKTETDVNMRKQEAPGG